MRLTTLFYALLLMPALVSSADAKHYRHRYHYRSHSVESKIELNAMRKEIASLRIELREMRGMWGKQATSPVPMLASIGPQIVPKQIIDDVIAGSIEEIVLARSYLIETGHRGATWTRQGDKAIGLLHPDFVLHLAEAIREARAQGLNDAGIYSAYRPPGYGVGGFRDKFKSLHSYGLAVDMHGIGQPGSRSAKLWHKIAAENSIACVYGPYNGAEWNHCQGTKLRAIARGSILRTTIASIGPIDPQGMWDAAHGILVAAGDVLTGLFADRTRIRHVRHRRHYRHA